MTSIELDDLPAFACRLADAAGEAIRPYFRRPIAIDDKADLTPVTAADRAAAGVRYRQAMRTASQEMDRIREDIRLQHGVLDIGGPAIRELRDALPPGQTVRRLAEPT